MYTPRYLSNIAIIIIRSLVQPIVFHYSKFNYHFTRTRNTDLQYKLSSCLKPAILRRT